MRFAYIKAYVERNKTDSIHPTSLSITHKFSAVGHADPDICETVTRPTMHFFLVKSPEEQAAEIVLKIRALFVRQRSQTVNAMRAGMTCIAKLICILRDGNDTRFPTQARTALPEMPNRSKC